MSTPGVVEDFLVVAESALALVGRVAVVQRWQEPSALPSMSVGALAAHLGSQVLAVRAAVTAGEGVTDQAPVGLSEHYRRVPWVGAALDHPANRAIIADAAEASAPGHDALVRELTEALEDLRVALDAPELPRAVRMPRWQWSLSFEDWLLTRVLELVVHSDDLAVSVEVEPPALPEPALGPVLALLVELSLRRHGQAAVVRALSRQERAGGISAL